MSERTETEELIERLRHINHHDMSVLRYIEYMLILVWAKRRLRYIRGEYTERGLLFVLLDSMWIEPFFFYLRHIRGFK